MYRSIAKCEAGVVEGKVENESSFLLCSDGFWHKITELEIYQALSNSKWNSKGQIEEKLHQLIQLNMNVEKRIISRLFI